VVVGLADIAVLFSMRSILDAGSAASPGLRRAGPVWMNTS